MEWLTYFTVSVLLGLTCTAPTDYFNRTDNEEHVVYRGQYDIDNILFPVNMFINVEGSPRLLSQDPIIFFAEADYQNGQRIDKGFYIRKNTEVSKLLEHGRDAATAADGMSSVYIAAEDGIYTYDIIKNKLEKFGAVTDDLVGIAKVNGSDILYILTKDHMVYRVTEQGTKKEKVVEIDNANQIVLDYENNLYYLTNNHINILSRNDITKVKSLPETITYMKLIKPPLLLRNAIGVVVDNNIYVVFANGTSQFVNSFTEKRPTAYAIEGAYIVYVGSDKKIYEYNIIAMFFSDIVKQVSGALQGFFNNIRNKLQDLRI